MMDDEKPTKERMNDGKPEQMEASVPIGQPLP